MVSYHIFLIFLLFSTLANALPTILTNKTQADLLKDTLRLTGNFIACNINEDCASNRCSMLNPLQGDLEVCGNTAGDECFCVAADFKLKCISDETCIVGTKCYNIKLEAANLNIDVCYPQNLANILQELGSAVGLVITRNNCIDVQALTHLESHQLVYSEHAHAEVLCDAKGSCATPGHIVVYFRKGMMMKTYCETVGGCTRKIIMVNSPRLTAVRRVESKTEGLMYTAFAARYETVVEEAAMAVLVRAGV